MVIDSIPLMAFYLTSLLFTNVASLTLGTVLQGVFF